MTYEQLYEYCSTLRDKRVIAAKLCCEEARFDAEARVEMMDMILDAIDKQIPKKPTESRIATIEMSAESVNWKIQYCCPVCKHSIIRHIKRNDYCNNCGQAIDWSDEECV